MPDKTCRTCADYRFFDDDSDCAEVDIESGHYCLFHGEQCDPDDTCTCHIENEEATE